MTNQDLKPAAHGLKPYHLNGADYAAMLPYDRMSGAFPVVDDDVAFYLASEVDFLLSPPRAGMTEALTKAFEKLLVKAYGKANKSWWCEFDKGIRYAPHTHRGCCELIFEPTPLDATATPQQPEEDNPPCLRCGQTWPWSKPCRPQPPEKQP